jgi:hypothetical protein
MLNDEADAAGTASTGLSSVTDGGEKVTTSGVDVGVGVEFELPPHPDATT